MQSQLFQVRFGSIRQRLRKGAALLLVYPVFAIGAIIGLQGVGSLQNPLLRFTARGFLIGCILYAVVYFVCRYLAIGFSRRRNRIAALKISGMPLWYVGILGAVGVASVFLWIE